MASCVASMGLDTKDVRLVYNCGLPPNDWIGQQQMGRAGRDGQTAVTINLAKRVRLAGPPGKLYEI